MRQLLPAGLFLVLLVVLAGAPLAEKLASNRAGLAAMGGCLKGHGGGDSWLPPFFRAVQFSCLGAPEAAEVAFHEALTDKNVRVDILRAHNPRNSLLAEGAVRHHSNSAEAYFWLGDALLASAQDSKAVQAYEKGLEIDAEDADTWDQLGRLYEAQGELKAAGRAFSQACRYVDRGKNGCPNAGRVYLLLGEYELAEQHYRVSLFQVPNFARSYRGLVDTLIARSGTSEGLAYVQALAAQGDAAAQQALNESD